jgi:hypothetical protein
VNIRNPAGAITRCHAGYDLSAGGLDN